MEKTDKFEHLSTKEKILESALELYNEQGTEVVTIRHIAAELGISHGNVGYHFPSTKDIVRALLKEMKNELDVPLAKFAAQENEVSPEAIYENVLAVYTLLEKYRFFLLDFTHIIRSDTLIKSAFRGMMTKRKEQLSLFFQAMRKAGFMRTDVPEVIYERLIKAILIIGFAWLPHRALLDDTFKKSKASVYAGIVFSLFVPYLTENGMKKFENVLEKIDSSE
jgi:AcrR family transcriptional regulator